MKKPIYMFALGMFATSLAFAQDAAPAAEEKKDEGKFTISGYIDSYYQTAFNNPKSGQLLGAGASRAFDRLTDQFALGLVQTKFNYKNSKSEVVVDLTFGPNAELGNFGNSVLNYSSSYIPSNVNKRTLYGSSIAIKQAYFTYNFTDKLSMTVGQFGTHIGYEVIDAPVNYHYSLSNLFNNGPFYHVGGKLSYAISGNASVMVGVVNNWDALTDWKKSKSLIAQVYVKPVEGWNVYLNGIIGANDDPFRVPTNNTIVDPNANTAGVFGSNYTRMLYDLTTGYQINDKFYLGLNAALGMYSFSDDQEFLNSTDGALELSKSASWYGFAVYPNYQISSMFGIGVRYEYFADPKGVRYIGTATYDKHSTITKPDSEGILVPRSVNGVTNQSITVTMPITLADGHLILKPEFRTDFADKMIYENSNGDGVKSQSTIGMAFIYKY
jgi:hypothetical protein